MQWLKRFGRWLWPRRDPQLWDLTGRDQQVKVRIVVANLAAPVLGFLELLVYGLTRDNWEKFSSLLFVTAVVGLICGAVLMGLGFLLSREFLARHRGAVFVAVAGTLVYGLVLLVVPPVSGLLLVMYWPVSPGLGALYALDLYVLLRLLLHPYRDRFWPRAGTVARQAD